MTHHYRFHYQIQLRANNTPITTLSQPLDDTLQKLQQQMVYQHQTVQILTDEVKIISQQLSTKHQSSSYLLLGLQQLERTLTYAVAQKLLHKLFYVWRNFI